MAAELDAAKRGMMAGIAGIVLFIAGIFAMLRLRSMDLGTVGSCCGKLKGPRAVYDCRYSLPFRAKANCCWRSFKAI